LTLHGAPAETCGNADARDPVNSHTNEAAVVAINARRELFWGFIFCIILSG